MQRRARRQLGTHNRGSGDESSSSDSEELRVSQSEEDGAEDQQVEVEVEDQRPTAQRLKEALAALPPPTPSRVLQVSARGANLCIVAGANVCISLINISRAQQQRLELSCAVA